MVLWREPLIFRKKWPPKCRTSSSYDILQRAAGLVVQIVHKTFVYMVPTSRRKGTEWWNWREKETGQDESLFGRLPHPGLWRRCLLVIFVRTFRHLGFSGLLLTYDLMKRKHFFHATRILICIFQKRTLNFGTEYICIMLIVFPLFLLLIS